VAVSTSVGTSGQVALILLDASASQRLTAVISSTTIGSGAIALFAPNGSQISSAALGANAFLDPPSLAAAGTYVIAVMPSGSATGSANLTIYNSTDLAGTIIPGGRTVSLTTTAPGQNMSLTFSGMAGQRVSLLAQPNSAIAGGCYTVNLTEPDGKTQLYSTFQCAPSTFSGVLVLPTTGTYSIYLKPSGPAVGSASFTLYSVPPDASGTIIPGGSAVSLTTTAPGQNMSLTFAGTASQRVSLLTQPNNAIAGGCYTVNLTEPDGKTQLYSTFQCASSTFSEVLVLPTTGTYLIYLKPSGPAVGSASLTLYSVPPNASGTITIGGGGISLTTTVPGQSARATFGGTAGPSVTVAVGAHSGGCFSITTLEPNGTTVLRGESHCGANYSSGSLSLPVSGTYTVVVTPSGTATDTYTVSASTP
jgi:hypothetical protein